MSTDRKPWQNPPPVTQARWLVLGPMDEQSAKEYRDRGQDISPTTSKTLVRGENRAKKLSMDRAVLPNPDDLNPEDKGQSISHLIDHGFMMTRRQRRANGL